MEKYCYCSQVCLLVCRVPGSVLYPRIRWSALFRWYACFSCSCRSHFFTREFVGLPCFAGMLACMQRARLASLPANSIVCLVSRVCLLQLRLPDALLYPRIRWPALFRWYACFSCSCRTRFFTREFLYSPCQELYLSILLLSYL